MNKWDVLLPATKRLLIALILLQHHQYVPKLISHMNVLLYHQKMNSKIWKMHVDDPACFNEEPGELSFAALGRAKGQDSSTDIFSHLNKLYPLVSCCIVQNDNVDCDEQFSSPIGKKQSDRFRVNPRSNDTMAVLSFFLTSIREMRSNMFMVYDGTNDSYKDKRHANAHKKVTASSLFWRTDEEFLKLLKAYIKKTKKQTIGCKVITNTEGLLWTDDPVIEDDCEPYQPLEDFIDPDEYVNQLLARPESVASQASEMTVGNLSQFSLQTPVDSLVNSHRHSISSPISLKLNDDFKHDSEMDVPSMHSAISDPYQLPSDSEASDEIEPENQHVRSVSSSSSVTTHSSSIRTNHDDIRSRHSSHSMGVPEMILEQKINKDRNKMYRIKWQGQAIGKATWEFAENYEKWTDYKFLIQDWKANMGKKVPGANRYKRRKTK